MSSRKDSPEIGVCHAYMNALFAHAQGRYTGLNVLAQVIGGDTVSSELINWAALIQKHGEYFSKVWNGEVFELDLATKNPDAEFLQSQVSKAIGDLTLAAREVEGCLSLGDQEVNREQVASLLSWLAYHAYSHEHYVKGLIKYGEVFELPQVSDRWRQHLLPCQQDIHNVHVLLSHLLGGETPLSDVHIGTCGEALLIPGILRAKAQDFMQLECIRTGEWSFHMVGINQDSATAWTELGFNPSQAGYWTAFGFDSAQSNEWMRHGFQDASSAASWNARRFTAPEALKWASAGVPAHQATSFREAGVEDPSQIESLH